MKDDLDRQANAVYRAVSALGTPGKLRDIEAVRAFVGRVTDDLGIEPIAVKEVDEAPPMAEQPEPIRSHAFVKAGERSIYVANLSRPMLSQQVLILHEIAHILTPTWPEGHGLDWARTFSTWLTASGGWLPTISGSSSP